VYFKAFNDFHDTDIYDRQKLTPGNKIDGPAIIESFDTTVIVLPDDAANIDAFGNIIITIEGRKNE
jgi:N-methylhydantoinase A